MTNPDIPPDFSIDGEDPPAGSTEPTQRPRAGVGAAPYVISIIFLLLLYILFSRSPLVSLVGAFVALVPAVISGVFVVRLATPELPKEFYIEQIFFGALPGFALALIAEVVLALIAGLTVFRPDIEKAAFVLRDHPKMRPNELASAIAREIGAWKVVVIALMTAFVLAAGVEETMKLVVGLRSKKLTAGGARDVGLSPHSVVVGVVGGALGLAMAEHFFYTVQMFSRMKSLLAATLVSLLRAVLAFPVHCGTAMIIGVALAKNMVLRTGAKVWPSFLLAVFIHGSFDAVAMVTTGLISSGVLPKSPWFGFGIILGDILVAVVLMVYCRRIYKSLGTNAGYETIESAV